MPVNKRDCVKLGHSTVMHGKRGSPKDTGELVGKTKGAFVRILSQIGNTEANEAGAKWIRNSVRNSNLSQIIMDSNTNNANVDEASTEQESRRGTGVHWPEKQRESSDPNNEANKVGETTSASKVLETTSIHVSEVFLTAVMFVVRGLVLYDAGSAVARYITHKMNSARKMQREKELITRRPCSHRQVGPALRSPWRQPRHRLWPLRAACLP